MSPSEPFNSDAGDIPERLARDLREVYRAPFAVSRQRDDAVLNAANARMLAWRRKMRLLRWGGGAAAAAILLAFTVLQWHSSKPGTNTSQNAVARAGDPMDLNRDGRVDILDAYYLARQIKSHPSSSEANATSLSRAWDINGDGVIDQKDIDLIAQRAVRLDEPKGAMK